MPRGRIEKMVPTEMLFSRLAEPSSGSIATQSGAAASRISGNSASSDRIAATGVARSARRIILSAARSMSFCASPSELTPLSRPVMPASGPSAIRSARLDRGSGDRLDHGGDRGTVRRLLRRAIEMRTQGHAFIHGRSPVAPSAGPFASVVPVGSPRITTSQFAKLVKFSYLWLRQSFPYKGGADGEPVSAGIDPSPVARAGRRSPRSIGDGGGQTAASDAAGRHAADPQSAGAGGPAADSAHQRRHAADRRRARGAGALRAHRSRDRRLRNLAGDDGGQDRRPDLDRRRQHREIFRAVHDLRIFEALSEHRRHALDRQPAGDRQGAARLRSRLRDHGPPAGGHRHGCPPDRRSSPCHHRADQPSAGAKIPPCAGRSRRRDLPDARARLGHARPDGATVRDRAASARTSAWR